MLFLIELDQKVVASVITLNSLYSSLGDIHG